MYKPTNCSEAACVSLGNHCSVTDDQEVEVIVHVSLYWVVICTDERTSNLAYFSGNRKLVLMIFWTWCTYTFLSWSKDSILTVRFKITGAQALNALQLQIQCQITYCSDIRVRDALALSLKGFLSCECDNLCWWKKLKCWFRLQLFEKCFLQMFHSTLAWCFQMVNALSVIFLSILSNGFLIPMHIECLE